MQNIEKFSASTAIYKIQWSFAQVLAWKNKENISMVFFQEREQLRSLDNISYQPEQLLPPGQTFSSGSL